MESILLHPFFGSFEKIELVNFLAAYFIAENSCLLKEYGSYILVYFLFAIG